MQLHEAIPVFVASFGHNGGTHDSQANNTIVQYTCSIGRGGGPFLTLQVIPRMLPLQSSC